MSHTGVVIMPMPNVFYSAIFIYFDLVTRREIYKSVRTDPTFVRMAVEDDPLEERPTPVPSQARKTIL